MTPEHGETTKIASIVDPDLVPFQPPERFPTGLSGLRTFLRNFIEIFPRSVYEHGLTRIKQGFIDTLVVCDPKLIQDVLVDRADVFRLDPVSRRTLATFTGESSIFLAEGAEWRWQRRAVAPTFRHEALLSFVPVFAEMAARQIARWRSAPRNAPIDVFPAMHQTTFDVIVETMLGGASAFDAENYRRTSAAVQDTALWQGLFALFLLPRWTPFPGRKRGARASAHLHQQMKRIVASRRAKPSTKPDLLDLLLAAKDAETGRGMTDDELATNLIAFVNAGHEFDGRCIDLDPVAGGARPGPATDAGR